MKTLKELNEEYLALTGRDETVIRQDYEAIEYYNQYESSAIYHGEYVRTAYIPKLLRQSDFDHFTEDIRLLYGIFEKVTEHFCSDEEYRKKFALTEEENRLILSGRRDIALLPMARIDFFYNEETGDYKFCEFNTDGTSAMNEDRELHLSQSRSRAYHAFREKYQTRICELFDSWVGTVYQIWKKAAGTDEKPYVAIVDYLECGLVHEFKVFAEHFRSFGIDAEICDVRELKYDGKELTGPAGRKIDVIYRRAVTSDVLKHLEQSQALIQAKMDGNVLLLGDFHTQIVHNKAIFRMLLDPATIEFLTEEEITYLNRHVPYTKLFTEEDRVKVAAERTGWILKPLDSYGSKGIYAGVEYTDEEWPEVVEKVPTEGYIMQEFCTPYVTKNYGRSEKGFGEYDYYNLTGIYVYNGKPQGVYSRASFTPIISTQYSEKTLPTLIIQGE